MTQNEQALKEMPIGKLMFQFAVPAILGMLINSLYNLVDRLFLGHVGALALTGVGLSMPLVTLMTAINSLIGVGASTLIAIKLGEAKHKDARQLFNQSLRLLIVITTFMMILGLLFLKPMLTLFGATPLTLESAVLYARWLLIGSVFQGIGITLTNVMRATGNPKRAMMITLIGTGINILLDPLLIFNFNLGIQGAAIATVIAQIISSGIALQYFISEKASLRIGIDHYNDHGLMRESLSIGFSPFMMQISQVFVMMILNQSLRIYGNDLAIGAMTIINSIIILLLLSVMGVAQGAQPIIGYNHGAKQPWRIMAVLRLMIITISSVCLIAFGLIQIFPHFWVGLFTADNNLSQITVGGLRIYLACLPLIGLHVVSVQYFMALGMAKRAALLSLLRQVVVLVPLLLILPPILGLKGVWLAAPFADAIASTFAGVLLLRDYQRLKRESQSYQLKQL